MSGAVDRRELMFRALAGLAGGAIGWLPVEYVSSGHSITESQGSGSNLPFILAMAFLSAMVGGLVNAAELQTFEFTNPVKWRFGIGAAVCFVMGWLSSYPSGFVFARIIAAGGWSIGHPGSIAALVLARVLSWTLMGGMLGVGVGLAGFTLTNPLKAGQNVLKGAAGGLIGGFIGGLTFDLLSWLSGAGLMPRLIGLSLIGLFIGLFIGLVQELTKTAWLAVDAGRLRGRQFRLEGSTIMMGRAEENPVGLFGDPGVQPRHAVIERRADGYALKNLAVQAGTFINGNRVETAVLHDGDQIKISNYELSFRERAGAPGRLAEVQPRAPLGVAAPAPVTTSATMPPSAPEPATISAGAAYLIAANGERIALRAGTGTQVGRALDNDIVVNDASVSRHHAVIEALNGAFTVRDLGSQNGTWMRGERINQAPIGEGDAIKFGDAIYTFHR